MNETLWFLSLFVYSTMFIVFYVSLQIDTHSLDEDALKALAYAVAPDGEQEAQAAALMMYVHDHGVGVCVEKSFFFERLSIARGLRARHIVLLDGDGGSHATTQININGTWVFYDAYYGKQFTTIEYGQMNFTRAYVHINCIDRACSNFNPVSKAGLFMFYIKEVR